MTKEQLKKLVEKCVYSEDGITYMSDKQYNNYIKENKQLKDNWNKLKEMLNNEIKHNKESDKKYNCEWKGYNAYYELLDKMKELENGELDEN